MDRQQRLAVEQQTLLQAVQQQQSARLQAQQSVDQLARRALEDAELNTQARNAHVQLCQRVGQGVLAIGLMLLIPALLMRNNASWQALLLPLYLLGGSVITLGLTALWEARLMGRGSNRFWRAQCCQGGAAIGVVCALLLLLWRSSALLI